MFEKQYRVMKLKFFILTALFAFFSCQQEPIEENNNQEPTIGGRNGGLANLVLSGEGEQKNVKISFKGTWSITAAPSSWLSVTPSSGINTSTVVIKALPNQSELFRLGTIIVSSGNENTTVKVKQEGTWLGTRIKNLHFSSTEESDALSLYSSGKWKATTSDPWIIINPSSGNGDADIIVVTLDNPSALAREGKVSFSSNTHAFSLPVIQEARFLNVSSDSLHFSKTGNTLTVSVSTDGIFDFDSNCDWLTISKGKDIVTVTASENDSPNFRESKFSIFLSNLKDGVIECPINVIQDGQFYGKENGHEWVDLGLPSGLLWANLNIGAVQTENNEYDQNISGDYFAWGETKAKRYYGYSTYKWFSGNATITKFSKYNTSDSYGEIDNKTQLEIPDDAANANWGGRWRIPTKEEWEELNAECDWSFSIGGFIATSKINGNTIFFPVGSYMDSAHSYTPEGGYYWASSLDSNRPALAWCFQIYSGWDKIEANLSGLLRWYGLNVRPVYKP